MDFCAALSGSLRCNLRKPIDLDRLQAALTASEFPSRNALAGAAGVVPTTITRAFGEGIRRRRQHRKGGPVDRPVTVNPATLEGLAGALRVPAEWLTGDLDSLPFVPKHGMLSGKSESDAEDVTAAKVRLSHLLASADTALRRDLQAWYGRDAPAAYQSWGWAILSAVRELAEPLSWLWAMVSSKSPDPGALLTPNRLDNSAAVSWLEQALAPWFEGEAYLNARVLRELFRALSTEPQRQTYTSSIEEADIIRALELYDASAAGGPLQTPAPPEGAQRRRGPGLRRWKRDVGDSGE